MTRAGIPTRYAGVNFRSRLEARWAAFFDLIHWRWDYEPFDLDGWIPDFIIEQKIFVEVKPIIFIGNTAEVPALTGELKKCQNIPSGHEGLILGTGPFLLEKCGCYEADDGTTSCIGILYERSMSDEFYLDDAILKITKAIYCNRCARDHNRMDLGGNHGNWSGRFFDDYNKMQSVVFDDVEQFWRDAGNAVQWRAVG